MAFKSLSTEQYVAISWLAQPKRGGKTYEQIAEICGVHPNTIGNWRKDALFERELKAQMIRNSQERLPELIESLAVIAIRDGNAAMAKLALQINGMLTDNIVVETKTNESVNVDALRERLDAFNMRKVTDSQSDI